MASKKIGVFYFLPAGAMTAAHRRAGGYVELLVGPAASCYVRAEEILAEDVGDALDRAQPRSGESVMNTHYLSVKDEADAAEDLPPSRAVLP